jgi:wobble nucleotide-excising tRNase
MILKISSLVQFGNYKSFTWDTKLPRFEKFNLIYGWNYSGKTTLSRVFRCLEIGKLEEDFKKSRFELQCEDGMKIKSENLTIMPEVHVYNRDFIDRNFSKNNTVVDSIEFSVGQNNIEELEKIERIKQEMNHTAKFMTEHSQSIDELEKSLRIIKVSKALEIKNRLKLGHFTLKEVDSYIERTMEYLDIVSVDKRVLEEKISSLIQYESLVEINWTGISLNRILEKLSLIKTDIFSLSNITDIMSFAEISSQQLDWLIAGLDLHRNEKQCLFCSGVLTSDRITSILKLASSRKSIFLKELDSLIVLFSDIRINSKLVEPSLFNLFQRPNVSNLCKSLGDILSKYDIERNRLINDLKEVRSGNLKAIEINNLHAILSEIEVLSNKILGYVNDHNRNYHDTRNRHQDLQKEVICEMIIDFVKSESYSDLIKKLENYRMNLSEISRTHDKLITQHNEILKKVDQVHLALDYLNTILQSLLNRSRVSVVKDSPGKFKFLRDGVLAKNLSDGELTAITFSYFVTSLHPEGPDFSKKIIFVDDPICSLDSNHIHSVYIILTSVLQNCSQVFVSTHNFELFQLLKSSWIGKKGGNLTEVNKTSSAYLVSSKVIENNQNESSLMNLPVSLRKYKSEYLYCFELLSSYASNPSPDYEMSLLIPNVLRKFLEAFLGFYDPSTTEWHKKLSHVSQDPQFQRTLSKIADEGSHLQDLERALSRPPYDSHIHDDIKKFMNEFRTNQTTHYDSLVQAAMQR